MPITITPVPQPRIVITPQGGGALTLQPQPAARIVVSAVGVQGPPGPAGVAQSYRFVQASASSLWTVNHNLGRRPIVQLETVGGVAMIGDIIHLSDNIFQAAFDAPTSGVASYI